MYQIITMIYFISLFLQVWIFVFSPHNTRLQAHEREYTQSVIIDHLVSTSGARVGSSESLGDRLWLTHAVLHASTPGLKTTHSQREPHMTWATASPTSTPYCCVVHLTHHREFLLKHITRLDLWAWTIGKVGPLKNNLLVANRERDHTINGRYGH